MKLLLAIILCLFNATDAVVNNAGILRDKSLTRLSNEDWGNSARHKLFICVVSFMWRVWLQNSLFVSLLLLIFV